MRSGDDNSLLDTGAGGSLSQGRPEVGVDGVAGGVGAVEPDVEVSLVVPGLILDAVGWQPQADPLTANQ